MVESNGHHALSCCRCLGRFPRHHALNDIVRRALVSANIPCILEPPGLSRSDGKRPDGMTLVPAADFAAIKKREKYSVLAKNYTFVPIAVETLGCWGTEAKDFIKEVGQRLRETGCDPRAGSFLVQRLSIAIQRGNAASVMGTFD
ncbi:hypothetical protein NE865_12269 [Phthorimaea operculella]|nr:hypothetical protein NE865_12269 [Phthorimaea operculella]